ncbi:hypothetical protein PROPHIT492_17 [Mycobacterium phage prophiT49-2]|nr:hypothetical protein PROPHIT492_17 [Mycobacterium phage prophiT49-2]
MTDPAIEAAQRALAEIGTGMSRTFTAEAAAREMAKTVQELHRPTYVAHRRRKFCVDCGQVWPCETAKRVYPSEEL